MKKAKTLEVRQEDVRNLKVHSEIREVGQRYVFSDSLNNPSGKIYTIVRRITNLSSPSEFFIQPHAHNDDSLWLLIGQNEDLTGLEVEVKIEDKTFNVKSPASIYLPAGVKHTYRPVHGSGLYVNIVLTKGGDYNESLLEQ
ncbi:MAG: hypothetical protein J7K33_11275 [Candidatus Marinimicrobia bacterium]|nr:hypothetical protein [Candidatus Neomarinimicrobiota bacterium]